MGTRRNLAWTLLLAALLLAGCAALGLARTDVPRLFVLDAGFERPPARDATRPTVLIAQPLARPGYDGPRMAYVKKAHEICFFARHQWVAAPAQMLVPLLIEALELDGRLHAVRNAAGLAPPLRLETEIVALQQEFTEQPSRTRFALRAQLVDVAERRTLATEAFEALEPAPSEDPYGGVLAANRAVARVLGDLAKWCALHAPASRSE